VASKCITDAAGIEEAILTGAIQVLKLLEHYRNIVQ
jgi:hypothetical protein